jgi:DEAD/DEAH box helicase domain-containing protein
VSRESPHRRVDLRSTGGGRYSIVIEDTGELLGTVDGSRAFWQVHPGAIYLHQGEQFAVRELDLDGRVALVSRADPDYYTQSRDITDIEVVRADERAELPGAVGSTYGVVRVTNQVVAYARRHVATGEILEIVPLALPPVSLETRAVWWSIPATAIDRAAIAAGDLPGAAHAAEHAAIGLLPLVATCDRWDVGGVSTAYHPDTDSCAIFVYDGYAGGAGISERGFRAAERWLEATLETVATCPCSHGCPACVQSPKCGNGNEPLDKGGAAALLAAMLGRAWG